MILTLCSPSSGDLAHAAWFFRITGNKYFVLYLTGSLVFPDHRQKIFRTLPITGKKYFVLYLLCRKPSLFERPLPPHLCTAGGSH
jgi:hypothetical protein